MTNRTRNGVAALLFLVCLVTLTSAFNLPDRSPDLSSRLASLSTATKPPQQHTTLTFADRVAYQRAIEEVYWRHRIWPKDHPDLKPLLDEVMPSVQVEKKVEDYLRDSQALEDYWQKPLSAEQLQAEMERMAQHTKQPEVLRELFAALGNDPFVIAECLARPMLAERFSADLAALVGVSPALGKLFAAETAASTENRIRVMANLDNAQYKLPEVSAPDDCSDDTWTATTTANAPSARMEVTAVWTGAEIIVWGGWDFSTPYLNTGGRYNPATDSWTATSTNNVPDARGLHTAVWSGSEMIVWGGEDSSGVQGTGGRYNPVTDSWVATSMTNVPVLRMQHRAVWTGSEMIVWGGRDWNTWFNSGGRYNPTNDSWTATSTTNAPTARWRETAIWTGSEMIVWGGTDGTNYVHTGGRYNPTTNSWTPTSITNAPLGRIAHTAVWTGSEIIVWGGVDETFNDTNTGGRYNPVEDTWMATSTMDAPQARDSHAAVWTGSKMIVWGGVFNTTNLDTGARYDPSTNSWTATSITNAPSGRYDYMGLSGIWTGSELVIWGGVQAPTTVLNTGGRYCAQSQAPMAQSAFSRKTHGAAGTFDIPLPLTGNVGVECRSGGATNDYQMIINFANSVTVGSASVTSGIGSVSSFSVSGSEVTVDLTGVTNVQRITVTLINVNDGTHMGNVPVSMGVLVGDVNGNGLVNASDVSLTKSQVGQAVSSSNFREDVNVNGLINSVDVALVKSKVGTALPP